MFGLQLFWITTQIIICASAVYRYKLVFSVIELHQQLNIFYICIYVADVDNMAIYGRECEWKTYPWVKFYLKLNIWGKQDVVFKTRQGIMAWKFSILLSQKCGGILKMMYNCRHIIVTCFLSALVVFEGPPLLLLVISKHTQPPL